MKNWKSLIVPVTVLFIAACSKSNEDAAIVNTQDITFVHIAAVSNAADILLSQVAADSSKTAAIKAFGQQIVAERTQADAQLRSLASQLGIPVPDTVDQKHIAIANMMKTIKDSARFDSLYIHTLAQDHFNTLVLYENTHGLGSNNSLNAYVQDAVPMLRKQTNDAIALSRTY